MNGVEFVVVDLQSFAQHLHVAIDGIVIRRPPRRFAIGHVTLIVVLCMSFATIRHEFEQRHTFATTRAIDSALGDVVHRKHIVAIRLFAGDAITQRLVHKLLRGRLPRCWRRIRVTVVLDDHDKRAALHGREVNAFVKRAGARRTIADVHETNAILLPHLERERHTRHHRHHVAQRRNLSDESAIGVAEVNVQLATARR